MKNKAFFTFNTLNAVQFNKIKNFELKLKKNDVKLKCNKIHKSEFSHSMQKSETQRLGDRKKIRIFF